MIIVDIPMPDKCGECPFSYYVTSGKCEGRLFCNAMEARDLEKYKLEEDAVAYDSFDYVVDEYRGPGRPEACPIIIETEG